MRSACWIHALWLHSEPNTLSLGSRGHVERGCVKLDKKLNDLNHSVRRRESEKRTNSKVKMTVIVECATYVNLWLHRPCAASAKKMCSVPSNVTMWFASIRFLVAVFPCDHNWNYNMENGCQYRWAFCGESKMCVAVIAAGCRRQRQYFSGCARVGRMRHLFTGNSANSCSPHCWYRNLVILMRFSLWTCCAR